MASSESTKPDNRPSLQFYPQDWLNEPGLKLCDLAAHGLWIDLICIMWDLPHRGELSIEVVEVVEGRMQKTGKFRPMTESEVAKLVCKTDAEVHAPLMQILQNGVASIRPDGTIYSRRLVREQATRDAKVHAARARWACRRHADTPKSVMQNGGSPTPSPSPFPSPLREKEHSHSIEQPTVKPDTPTHEDFKKLCERYPKRIGVEEAWGIWQSTVYSAQQVQNINKALDNYIAEIRKNKTEARFIKSLAAFMRVWPDYVDYKGPDEVKPENPWAHLPNAKQAAEILRQQREGTKRAGADKPQEAGDGGTHTEAGRPTGGGQH